MDCGNTCPNKFSALVQPSPIPHSLLSECLDSYLGDTDIVSGPDQQDRYLVKLQVTS